MLQTVKKRQLDNVGAKVWAAVQLIEEGYGGRLTNDSGHENTSPTWIFTFSQRKNAQLALRMNKEKLSVYLRKRTLDGRSLDALMNGLAKVDKESIRPDEGVAASLLGNAAPFLNPSPANPLLRISLELENLPRILDLYFNEPSATEAALAPEINSPSEEGESGAGAGASKRRRTTSADELLEQLDRNAATGRQGEQLVFIDELQRLHECGCPVPKDFVELKAVSDVGCGYDIASTWPGEERYIEVKTTTVSGSDYFMTDNEFRVLGDLGEKAWLYRVVLTSDGNGEISARIKDPANKIRSDQRIPVVWRVKEGAFSSSDS